MNAPINLHSVLASLREENDILRETVRQLREELAPARVFPPQWRLRRQHDIILSCIMAASPGIATHRRLLAALYQHDDEPIWADSILSVNIYEMRKRMRSAGTEPGIESVPGRGYMISPEDRDRLLATPFEAAPPIVRKGLEEPAWWAEARRMKSAGAGYRAIARACSMSRWAVRRAVCERHRTADIERHRRRARNG